MPSVLVLIVMVGVLLFRSDAVLAVFTELNGFEENTGRELIGTADSESAGLRLATIARSRDSSEK